MTLGNGYGSSLLDSMQPNMPFESATSPLDETYVFSLSARRAIFFAKYEASQRNTDEVTHHITVDDLLAGIARERRPWETEVKP
jgi:hypothetical protein